MEVEGNRIRIRDVIVGMIAQEDRFYILLIHPRIEILEIDLEGHIVDVYWKRREYKYFASGIFITRDEQLKNTKFYLLRMYPSPGVEVLAANGIN
jgi:hypothetical protein